MYRLIVIKIMKASEYQEVTFERNITKFEDFLNGIVVYTLDGKVFYPATKFENSFEYAETYFNSLNSCKYTKAEFNNKSDEIIDKLYKMKDSKEKWELVRGFINLILPTN